MIPGIVIFMGVLHLVIAFILKVRGRQRSHLVPIYQSTNFESFDPFAPGHLKLVRFPASLATTHRDLPSMSLFPEGPADLSVCPSMSLASSRLHSTLVVAYDVFLPRKHPSGFPSMSHRCRRAPFSLTHDLPSSLVLSLPLENRYPRGFSVYPTASQFAVFALSGLPVHLADSQSARLWLGVDDGRSWNKGER